MTDSEFDLAYANEQLRRSRHPLRKFIKQFYLGHVLSEIHGPTIDFGCGAGQLLSRLPAGSIGVEINSVLVAKLADMGLNVVACDAIGDDFSFAGFAEGHYKTMVISHVLEHFADSATVMRKIWRACARLRIDTIIVVVPGAKGYAADTTHKTFITEEYLAQEGLTRCEGFEIAKIRYFPINVKRIGEFFTFHELHTVFTRVNQVVVR